MKYRRLGQSGLWVSEIGLGTNNFGTRLDVRRAQEVLDVALEHGITYIDTADIYGSGSSEELLGRTLGARRRDVVLATKVGKPMGESRYHRGSSRRWIMEAVEGSLRRLQTDYIDLYQLHEPDATTPILETIQTLDDLVRSGKVRYVGTSNFGPSELVDAHRAACSEQRASPISAQYVYNLIEALEDGILQLTRRLSVGLIAARPLAYGFLTGKFHRDVRPAGARLPESMRAQQILTPANFTLLERLEAFAANRGHTILELALGYLLGQAEVTSVVASASSREQLLQNIGSAGWPLSASDIEAVAVLRADPNS